MGLARPRHPEHKRRWCRAFFTDQTAVLGTLTFCQCLPAYCLWVWLKKKKKGGGRRKMQLLKLEETECRPHRDNHRLMWHSSITTATIEKPLSSRKVVWEKTHTHTHTAVLYRNRFHSSVNFSFFVCLDVLRSCRSVMACCAQMDLYEASQPHLFHYASIKVAEVKVLCSYSTSGH